MLYDKGEDSSRPGNKERKVSATKTRNYADGDENKHNDREHNKAPETADILESRAALDSVHS